jgi:hypothetical protein
MSWAAARSAGEGAGWWMCKEGVCDRRDVVVVGVFLCVVLAGVFARHGVVLFEAMLMMCVVGGVGCGDARGGTGRGDPAEEDDEEEEEGDET